MNTFKVSGEAAEDGRKTIVKYGDNKTFPKYELEVIVGHDQKGGEQIVQVIGTSEQCNHAILSVKKGNEVEVTGYLSSRKSKNGDGKFFNEHRAINVKNQTAQPNLPQPPKTGVKGQIEDDGIPFFT